MNAIAGKAGLNRVSVPELATSTRQSYVREELSYLSASAEELLKAVSGLRERLHSVLRHDPVDRLNGAVPTPPQQEHTVPLAVDLQGIRGTLQSAMYVVSDITQALEL